MAAGLESIKVGQVVTGKFLFSRGAGLNPVLGFPKGVVTEVGEKEFKVQYNGIKGTWTHRESDIEQIVFPKESEAKLEEQIDHISEQERLGIEE